MTLHIYHPFGDILVFTLENIFTSNYHRHPFDNISVTYTHINLHTLMVCHPNIGGCAASGNACPLLCSALACRAARAGGVDVRSAAAARASSAFG